MNLFSENAVCWPIRRITNVCGHTTFVQPTSALTVTIIDNIKIYNDVNKTGPSIQLLAINILRYFVLKKKMTA